ncbi:unnamed protein product, partial [Prorocentrum cordatum]
GRSRRRQRESGRAGPTAPAPLAGPPPAGPRAQRARGAGAEEARARCEKSAFGPDVPGVHNTRSSPGQEAGREEEAKRAGSCKGRGRRRRGEPLARGGRAPAAGLRRGATGRVELPPACSPPRCGAGASRLSRAP